MYMSRLQVFSPHGNFNHSDFKSRFQYIKKDMQEFNTFSLFESFVHQYQ